ncbi:MAG: cupredoxin domain-containing protein [Armatimonadetes bacterium]|nr:cupredoxin domain-containing protein [Armatimonadota bacterium]
MWRVGFMVVFGAGILAAVVSQSAFSGQAPSQVVQVELKEFAFVPKSITVKPGAVRIEAVNKGAIEHDLVITNLKNATTQTVRPGKTGTLSVTLGPGSYQVICNVPGHKEAGMVATLVAK